MNGAHVHLMLNHFPVIGTALAVLLLLAAVAAGSRYLFRASLAFIVFLAVLALPVYFTGEPAEDQVEDLPGVSEPHIEPHEEAALMSRISLEILGAIALFGLFRYGMDKLPPRPFLLLTLFLAIVVAGLMARTANYGGAIHHSEIRSEG